MFDKMTIHYISPFSDSSIIKDYMTTPSARAKVEYIKNSLKNEGFSVSLFSPIRCRLKNKLILNRRFIRVDELEVQHYPFSFCGDSFFLKTLSYIVIYLQLLWYLSTKVKKNEIVLLYHAISDTYFFKYYCKLRALNIFLEVEELYSAVYNYKENINKEKELIRSFPKGYILVNSLIKEKCRITKPSVVCEGQYRMLTELPKPILNSNDVVNLLYAGVLQKDSDVFLALSIAEFLDSRYCLHIAGYGDYDTEQQVLAKVEELNKKNGCKLVYHGCLYGEDYEKLLQQCSIGLCTRVLENALSDYTFPSKVFAYLSRNLKVICTPISCVLNSTISNTIVFSKTVAAEDIVSAIRYSIDGEDIDNSFVVNAEDLRFKKEISELINTI